MVWFINNGEVEEVDKINSFISHKRLHHTVKTMSGDSLPVVKEDLHLTKEKATEALIKQLEGEILAIQDRIKYLKESL